MIPIYDNVRHPLPSQTMAMPPIAQHRSYLMSLSLHKKVDDQTSDSNQDSSSSSSDTEEEPASPQMITSRSSTSDIAPRAGRLESVESKIPKNVATVQPTSPHPKHLTTAQHHKSQPTSPRQMDQRAARQEAVKHDAAEIKQQRRQNAADAKKHNDEQESDKLRLLQIQKAERDLRSNHHPFGLPPIHYYPPHRHVDYPAIMSQELHRKAAAYSKAMHNEAMVRASKERADALREQQSLIGKERVLAAMQRKASISEYNRTLHPPHHFSPAYMPEIRERQELHDMQVAHNQRIYDKAQYKHDLHQASPEETHREQWQQHKQQWQQQQRRQEQQREHEQKQRQQPQRQLANQREQIVALNKEKQELLQQRNHITNLKSEVVGLQREMHNKPGNK